MDISPYWAIMYILINSYLANVNKPYNTIQWFNPSDMGSGYLLSDMGGNIAPPLPMYSKKKLLRKIYKTQCDVIFVLKSAFLSYDVIVREYMGK